MGGGHHHHAGSRDLVDRLLVDTGSLVHRVPAHVKVLTLLGFVFAVVLTPAAAYWAFVVYALLLVGVCTFARVSIRIIVPRMVIELPFVLFAVLMPLLGPAPYVHLGAIRLSEAGLLAAWNILAKGTLGVFASLLLSATTSARDIVSGLERLRVPHLLVQIASFMLRYVHVVTDEMHRMHQARLSRGFRPRTVRSWPVLARGVGVLFIRSFERGERVHRAMLARGFTGAMPQLVDTTAVRPMAWLGALTLPLVAAATMMVAWLTLP